MRVLKSVPSLVSLVFALSGGLLLSACDDSESEQSLYTGYVEARYAYVATPQSGWLEDLSVTEGDAVEQGKMLFKLDTKQQEILVDQAKAKLAEAEARLKDSEKGARQVDLKIIQQSIIAQQAQVEYALAEKQRWLNTAKKGFSSESSRDNAIANYDIAKAKLEELKQRLAQAKLAAREDQITAYRQAVVQSQANLQNSEWVFAQRQVLAKTDGTVDQVFFRPGEFVNAGTPVLSLIIQDQRKIRFFVPEAIRSRLKLADTVNVLIDGKDAAVTATIDYIARDAEFTPPVIYSKEVRDKLVFMVEAKLPLTSELPVGQPVDVTLQ